MKKIIFALSVLCLSLILVLSYVIYDKHLIIKLPAISIPKVNIPKVTPAPTNTMLDELSQHSIDKDVSSSKEIKVEGMNLGGIKQGTIEASNFKFVPDAIQVAEGDTVIVTIKSTQGIHNFTIDELNIKSKTLQEGESQEITFVAAKKGVFKFYDSVGQHRSLGLEGTISIN